MTIIIFHRRLITFNEHTAAGGADRSRIYESGIVCYKTILKHIRHLCCYRTCTSVSFPSFTFSFSRLGSKIPPVTRAATKFVA